MAKNENGTCGCCFLSRPMAGSLDASVQVSA